MPPAPLDALLATFGCCALESLADDGLAEAFPLPDLAAAFLAAGLGRGFPDAAASASLVLARLSAWAFCFSLAALYCILNYKPRRGNRQAMNETW